MFPFSLLSSLIAAAKRIYHWLFMNLFEHWLINLFDYAPSDKTYNRSQLPLYVAEHRFYKSPFVTREGFTGIKWNKSGTRTLNVYFRTWWLDDPNEVPLVDVIWVHGLYGYGGRISRYIDEMLHRGIRITSVDLPGHGRSEGIHGLVESLDHCADAVAAVRNTILQHFNASADARQSIDRPSKTGKFFLWGASMGGLVSLYTSITIREISWDGLVLICPALTPAKESRPHRVFEIIAKLLCFVTPRVAIHNGHQGKGSSDPVALQELLNDPMVYHGGLRIQTGMSLLKAFDFMYANMESVSLPFLVIHGDADRVVHISGSQTLYTRSRSKNKTLKVVPDGEHDLYGDNNTAIFSDISEWILKNA